MIITSRQWNQKQTTSSNAILHHVCERDSVSCFGPSPPSCRLTDPSDGLKIPLWAPYWGRLKCATWVETVDCKEEWTQIAVVKAQ